MCDLYVVLRSELGYLVTRLVFYFFFHRTYSLELSSRIEELRVLN